MPRTEPPFRADHVGSLLRPTELHEARLKAEKAPGSGGGQRRRDTRRAESDGNCEWNRGMRKDRRHARSLSL